MSSSQFNWCVNYLRTRSNEQERFSGLVLIASQVASHLPSSATSKNQNYPSETNIKDPSTSGNTAWFTRSQGTTLPDWKKDCLSLLGVLVVVLLCIFVVQNCILFRFNEHRLRCPPIPCSFNYKKMMATLILNQVIPIGMFSWGCSLRASRKRWLKTAIKIQRGRWKKIGRNLMVAETTSCFIILFSLLLYVFEIVHNKNEGFLNLQP